MNLIDEMKGFKPRHSFFVGVDSDGCAFDTMETKHKKVFIPLALRIWGLEKIEKEFIRVSEFVNLYSQFRGTNRFPALVMAFKYLKEIPDVPAEIIPDFHELEVFSRTSAVLSATSLKEFARNKNSEFLRQVIMWSEEGDRQMERLTEGNMPFHFVNEGLRLAATKADTMVISAAAGSALQHEWGQCGLLKYMSMVAGQEAGPKKDQLCYAIQGKYAPNRVILLGDAPGDLKAAKANGALFYPINPGKEALSWKLFYEKVFDRFIEGSYAGEYEAQLINEFQKSLPEEKTW